MSPEQARIRELEKTVEGLVAYLRTLPVHPATYHQAIEAEKVLTSHQPKSSFIGARYYPDGMPLIAVYAQGFDVTVRMQDVSNLAPSFQAAHKHRVLADLTNGAKVRIEPGSFKSFIELFD